MKNRLVAGGIIVAFTLSTVFATVEASKFEDIMGYDVEFNHRRRPAPPPPPRQQHNYGVYVAGRIVDKNDEVIPNAQVEFNFIDGQTYYAMSDYYGRYEAYIPGNLSCDVFVSCDGYRMIHQQQSGFLNTRQPTELNFRLYHDWITGKVTDVHGYPISDVRITIEENSISQEVYSDYYGNFRLYLPENGVNYYVEILHAGYKPYRTKMILHDEDHVDFTMMIES